MGFGNFLGNPAVAGALSLGAGLAKGAAQERQTQHDYRRKMAELSYRQKLGMQDFAMKRAINSRFPGPSDRAALARRTKDAQDGINADRQYISERSGTGGARVQEKAPPSLGPEQEPVVQPPPPLTNLIYAIRNDQVDPNAAYRLRDQYRDHYDWGEVEKEIKEKLKELKKDKAAAAKDAQAGITNSYIPPTYMESPEKYLPGGGAGTGGLPGSGGDPAGGASLGGTNIRLPDGRVISSDELDRMSPEQIMALQGGTGQQDSGQFIGTGRSR